MFYGKVRQKAEKTPVGKYLLLYLCEMIFCTTTFTNAMAQTLDVKHEAMHIVEQLPDNATWDDLMYSIYVRQAAEKGLEDSDAGRTIDIADVKRMFGIQSQTKR